jgi:hypothetical protein
LFHWVYIEDTCTVLWLQLFFDFRNY